MEAAGDSSTKMFKFVVDLKDPKTSKNNTILLRDAETTIFDLKSNIARSCNLEMNTFDVYYNDAMLTEDDEKLKVNIPKNFTVEVLLRFPLKVVREDEEAVEINVNDKWTVGQLKTKLRGDYNFSLEFELQHPDEPGTNLAEASSMASIGVSETSSKLIAVETKEPMID
ncbi:hypothetical protein ACFE04_003065 [Oxalis oulophora]